MSRPEAKIVVVDDEKYICGIIEEALKSDYSSVKTFTDPDAALAHIENNPVDLVLTDLLLGDYSGVHVLERTLASHDDAIVILMTAHPTVQTAISVLKKGAYDFLVKPFKLEVLRATIRRGLSHQKVIRENLRLRSQVEFLKVANVFGIESDIDDYLASVLGSCRTELAAAATGILEVNPRTGEVIRRLFQGDRDDYTDVVLDPAHLSHFRYTRSAAPFIKTDRVAGEGSALSRILIAKPIFIRHRLHGVITVLIVDRFEQVTPGQMDVLSILANSAAAAIANFRLYQDLQNSYIESIRALAQAIEARDECTRGHTDRVVKLAELVATELDWSERQMRTLAMGCTLHDIGKLGVPDSILNKQGELSDDERAMMQSHPDVGLKIVKGIELLKPAIPYIIAHHERYDGSGYPRGLKGKEIPIEGRLLSVVDTLDAILSDRPYRKGAPLETALRELWDNRGTQFDPEIVEILFQLIRAGKIDFISLYGVEVDVSCVDDLVPISETARA